MCRAALRPEVAVLIAAVLVTVLPLDGRAQQTPEEERLVRLVDSLAPLVREAAQEARAARVAYNAARLAEQSGLDTIQIGPARVVIGDGQADAARDVIGSVWEEDFAPWAGPSPAFEWSSVHFFWGRGDNPFLRSASSATVTGSSFRSLEYMQEGARNALGIIYKRDLRATPLSTWAHQNAPVRRPADPENLYRGVAVAPSRAARQCLEGDTQGCLAALALEMDDTPFDEWYTPAERIYMGRRIHSGDQAALKGCHEGALAACDALLMSWRTYQQPVEGRAGGDPYWGTPLRPEIRNSLLWFALDRGGEGAWARLLERAQAGPAEALAHASGIPLSTLVQEWQAWVVEHRPRKPRAASTGAGTAVLWTLIFMAFAARSTRWRLG